MATFNTRGRWWRKDTTDWQFNEPPPSSATAGILSMEEDGGSLELIGALSKLNVYTEDLRLFGVTTDGNPVTLQADQSKESYSVSTYSFRTEEYHIREAYVGGFVPEDATFWRLSFSLSNLPKWTNFRGLETPGDALVPEGPAKTVEAVLDDADIVLRAYEDTQSRGPSFPSKAFFNVHPSKPLTFDEFYSQYLRPLQNLVTLGVGKAVYPHTITVYPDRYGPRDSVLRVYSQIPYYRESDDVSPNRMPFTLSDLTFSSAVEAWFDSVEQVSKFHDRYFGRKYNQEMFLDSEFLSLVVGLELYHREIHPSGSYMSDKAWKQVRERMIRQLPELVAKDRIAGLIRNIGNRYSLGDRLRDIVDEHEELVEPMFDTGTAVSDAVGARIDIAHGTDHEELEIEELHRRKERVDVIATACLLDILDLDIGLSKQILTDMYHY